MSSEEKRERVRPDYDRAKARLFGKEIPEKGPVGFTELHHAFHDLRVNNGKAAGPDGLKFDSLTESQWNYKLKHLAERIQDRRYEPGPARLASIPKGSNRKRDIRIANILDRCVQKAVGLQVSEQVDGRFKPNSFGFRPKLSTFHMLANIEKSYLEGFSHVAVVDVVNAFDNVRKRDVRNAVTEMEIDDDDLKYLVGTLVDHGGVNEHLGLDQGSSLSPVLFNCFMHVNFDSKVEQHPEYHQTNMRVYRYADDIVLMSDNANSSAKLIHIGNTLLADKHLQTSTKAMADLKTAEIPVLGFRLRGHNRKMTYRTSDQSWSKLLNDLDLCHTKVNPTGSFRSVLLSWINSQAPSEWCDEDHKHLDRILESVSLDGVNQVPDRSKWFELRETILGYKHHESLGQIP